MLPLLLPLLFSAAATGIVGGSAAGGGCNCDPGNVFAPASVTEPTNSANHNTDPDYSNIAIMTSYSKMNVKMDVISDIQNEPTEGRSTHHPNGASQTIWLLF